MTLQSKLRFEIKADLSTATDFSTPSASVSRIYQAILADGTTAGKADQIFADQRTLAASATEDLDLAGTLADPLSATISFARIKGLLVAASAGNTNNVVLGNATSNAWAALLGTTGTLIVRPGSIMAVFAGVADATGYAVTAGTADLLKVANSGAGTSVTYDIVIIGASA